MDLGLRPGGELATGLGGEVVYMLCTSLICRLAFTCLLVTLRTTLAGGVSSIPMNGFSCSMGGEGALLTLEGPEVDLALLPFSIKLNTAPCLPTIELVRLPRDPTRLSTWKKSVLNFHTLECENLLDLCIRGRWRVVKGGKA